MNQFKTGVKVEMEHKGLSKKIERYEKKHKGKLPGDMVIGGWIASAHLKEDKNYYAKLKKAKL